MYTLQHSELSGFDLEEDARSEEARAGGTEGTEAETSLPVEEDDGEMTATGAIKLTEAMEEVYRAVEETARLDGQIAAIPTGYPSLDRMLLGLKPGQVVTIGSRTGVGKTSFALNLALSAAADATRVFIETIADSGEELVQRLICCQAMVNISNFRSGRINPEEWANINEAIGKLSKLDVFIGEHSRLDTDGLADELRTGLADAPGRTMVIIDYLQLMHAADSRAYHGNKTAELTEIMRELKAIAKELNTTIVVLSQLKRTDLSKSSSLRPKPWELSGSGSIEQISDIVILLDRSESMAEAERDDRPSFGYLRVMVVKNANPATGDIDLIYLPPSSKYYEIDESA